MSKTIVITGAGSGLGRALARRFAHDGETVVLLGRTASKIDAVAAELGDRAFAVQCDVSSPDAVRAAFRTIAGRHARIDVLINNAGTMDPFLIAEATDEQILGTVGTNLIGPLLCSRSAIPLMGRGGHIINVSSESVDLPFPHLAVYQTTKAGLERFSNSLYREVEPDGIRVSCVRAGQMIEADRIWDIDPVVHERFMQACASRGLNMMVLPISEFSSATQIFRSLIDLPQDLHAALITLHARASS